MIQILTRLVLGLIFVSHGLLAAHAQAPQAGAQIHLLPQTAEKKALLIFAGASEAKAAVDACVKYGIRYELVPSFDLQKQDYRTYHTIMGGSNAMDFFGTEETKKPEAFLPLEKFVSSGGHLIIMGVFNGRNTEHLKVFGVTCGFQQTGKYGDTPATKLFFEGCEDLVPKDNKLYSVGNFAVAVPHVVLMSRTDDPQQPVLTTQEHGRGRFTFNLVEPDYQGDLWLITALLNWASRGGPTPNHLPAVDSLLKVPDEAAEKAAETLLRDTFKKDYAKIAQPGGKLALARLLLEQDYSQEKDPAIQYVALNEARTYAAGVGEVQLAFQAIDLLAATYQMDVSEARLETLTAVGKTVRDKLVLQSAGRLALDFVEQTIAEDQYATTAAAIAPARALAQKAQDKHLQSLVTYYDKRGKALAKEFQKIEKSAALAKKTPPDTSARSELGKFYCFVKEDWTRGLPMLGSGGDKSFQDLANRDLANPREAKERVDLANDWWLLAELLPTEQKGSVQRHAASWYYRAIPLLTGLTKTSIQNKVEKVPTTKAQLIFRIKKHHQLLEFEITPQTLQYRLLESGLPDAISINDFLWDFKAVNSIPNSGGFRYLSDSVDLHSAKLTPTRGRGTVELEQTPDGIKIKVLDPPDAADDYEFRLTFGAK